MEEDEYYRMHAAERDSWWFAGRRAVLAAVIGRLGLPEGARIADIGCGTGANLPMLAGFGAVTGVEPSATAAAMARERAGCEVVEGAAEATGLPAEAFDLVTLLDVLEHLDEEAPALAEVRRVLAPGGRLLITVPAFMLLWSGHDVALHHRRRYRRPALRAALEAAGLAVDWLSYYNAALFPPIAAVRVARRLTGGGAVKADVGEGLPRAATRALEALFAAERHVVGRVRLPFGVSLVGVARRA